MILTKGFAFQKSIRHFPGTFQHFFLWKVNYFIFQKDTTLKRPSKRPGKQEIPFFCPCPFAHSYAKGGSVSPCVRNLRKSPIFLSQKIKQLHFIPMISQLFHLSHAPFVINPGPCSTFSLCADSSTSLPHTSQLSNSYRSGLWPG